MTAQNSILTSDLLNNNSQLGGDQSNSKKKDLVYHRKIKWPSVVVLLYFHIAAVYGLYLLFAAKAATNIFTLIWIGVSAIGGPSGMHRLWCHRSYKAAFPLRVFLMIIQSSGYQRSIFHWARDHRCHHKFTDTDADPHNTKRGMFFAHCGWLMVNRHPLLLQKGNELDLSDLERDEVVMFQKRHYNKLMLMTCFIIPTFVPIYFWGEMWSIAYHIAIFRYVYMLNITWMINSLVHAVGMRPYDKNISATDNRFYSMIYCGEGFHNHHHAFPRDYRTGEFGGYAWNLTTGFIDLCAWLGLASDLKITSPEIMAKRVARTGDGSHIHHDHKIGELTDNEMFGQDDFIDEEDKKYS